MLLSLRSSPQIQRYIYKSVIVYVQAVFITVKNIRSKLNFSYFYFIFNLFSFILYLGLGLEWQYYAVTQQVTSDDIVINHMTYRRM